MVGVLMSSKTLAGQPNKWPGRYPKKEDIADIFVDDPRALNLIHYSTDSPETLATQLVEITKLAGPYLDGFQLNITWPPILEITNYRIIYPDKFLVLQIGRKAMDIVVKSAEQLAGTIGWYHGIDAVLIDSSGGRGEPLDAAKAAEYLRAIRRIYPTLGVGIAGGLGPDTLHSLDPLVREFTDLSIDAEGRLRTAREDALRLGAMQIYLEDAPPILDAKELPGLRLTGLGAPYGFEGHISNYGLGVNMLRTPRLAQPRALRVGDVLATGDRVLSLPREGYNGSVFIHLTGGFDGHWVGVPARIPIALLTEEDKAPAAVRKFGEK